MSPCRTNRHLCRARVGRGDRGRRIRADPRAGDVPAGIAVGKRLARTSTINQPSRPRRCAAARAPCSCSSSPGRGWATSSPGSSKPDERAHLVRPRRICVHRRRARGRARVHRSSRPSTSRRRPPRRRHSPRLTPRAADPRAADARAADPRAADLRRLTRERLTRGLLTRGRLTREGLIRERLTASVGQSAANMAVHCRPPRERPAARCPPVRASGSRRIVQPSRQQAAAG